MQRLYLAAIHQNAGKTTMALGLIASLRKRGLNLGFIKPVGQRTVEVDEHVVDEDSWLMEEAFHLGAPIHATSPVTVGKGFTVRYITDGDVRPLKERIFQAFDLVSANKDLVIIEGTGHAGVGSVFDLSNATVASMLGAKVLVVTSGGIGQPIDELMLNKALFDHHGVPTVGAIVNKVMPERYDYVKPMVTRGFARLGVDTLGVLPLGRTLPLPTIEQIFRALSAELVNAKADLHEPIEGFMIGAMTAHHALGRFRRRVLVIVPGDRDDIVLAAMSSCVTQQGKRYCASCICLTGGRKPHRSVLRLIQQTDIPVIAVPEDDFTVASAVHDMVVKIQPSDQEKIAAAEKLVAKYVDLDLLLSKL